MKTMRLRPSVSVNASENENFQWQSELNDVDMSTHRQLSIDECFYKEK